MSHPPADQPTSPVSVTEIRESSRQPGRYHVRLSDARRFTVSAATLAQLGLTRLNTIVSPDVQAKLERESAINNIVHRALASIARARRTRLELHQRLRRIEPDQSIIVEALDRIEHQGLLSDTAVAHAEAGARLRKGEGPARVRQQLRRKGIDQHTADEALNAAIGNEEYDEDARCSQAAERRYRSLAKLEPTVARRRLVAFLQRRGFSGAAISKAVKTAGIRNSDL